MECSVCGSKNPPGTGSCRACGTRLPTPVRDGLPPTLAMPAGFQDRLLGQVIDGKYTLLEELGSGGMGVVYLAEQTAPVRRRVALKVIKLGMDTRDIVTRFEAERQALAVMSHPNIARVFDAGTTESGRPYFVMELVPGVPITEYCDRNKLGTARRLELCLPVCQAVQHAHQKGVIHRDLKPTNILVTEQDGVPVPKVIDFGIARATEHRLSAATLFTEQGQLVGTPDYMSPEQADPSGLDIDTRTDIYSLGVVLYELLAGELPFDPARLRAGGLAEIQKVIREVEPPRASTRVGTRKETCLEVADKRGTDPGSLRRQLRGDVDWITMKAMAKDRTRRYASASELAADIERHLASEPVLAGPPRTSYRLGKYIRRHKLGVTAAFVVLAAILVGTAGTTLGFLKARREEKKALTEAETSRQVSNFLISLFQVSDPSESKGNTVTAREILDQGAAQIEKGLAAQPLTQARLMTTIGEVYMYLGLYGRSETMLGRALDLRRHHLGERNAEVAGTLQDVGALYERQGKYAEADKALREALKISEDVLGPAHVETAVILHHLGVLSETQGRFEQAESFFRRSLEIRQRALGPDDPEVARSLNSLAIILLDEGKYDAAEPIFIRSLQIKEKTLGPDDPDVANTLTNLAVLYRTKGKPTDAETCLLRALAITEKVYGPDHPEVAGSLNDVAAFYEEAKKYPEAEADYRRAMEILEKAVGPEHSDMALVQHNLANLYRNQGRYKDAESLYLKSESSWVKSLGVDHPYVASSLRERGTLYREMGRLAESEELYKRAAAIQEKVLGPDHLELGQTLADYAILLRKLKRDKEADALDARAKSIKEEKTK